MTDRLVDVTRLSERNTVVFKCKRKDYIVQLDCTVHFLLKGREPLIRYTILALYKFICMYVCMNIQLSLCQYFTRNFTVRFSAAGHHRPFVDTRVTVLENLESDSDSGLLNL